MVSKAAVPSDDLSSVAGAASSLRRSAREAQPRLAYWANSGGTHPTLEEWDGGGASEVATNTSAFATHAATNDHVCLHACMQASLVSPVRPARGYLHKSGLSSLWMHRALRKPSNPQLWCKGSLPQTLPMLTLAPAATRAFSTTRDSMAAWAHRWNTCAVAVPRMHTRAQKNACCTLAHPSFTVASTGREGLLESGDFDPTLQEMVDQARREATESAGAFSTPTPVVPAVAATPCKRPQEAGGAKPKRPRQISFVYSDEREMDNDVTDLCDSGR